MEFMLQSPAASPEFSPNGLEASMFFIIIIIFMVDLHIHSLPSPYTSVNDCCYQPQ